MKAAKRNFFILLSVFLAVILGAVLYCETHFTVYESVQKEIGAETALRECPQLEITEADLAMSAAALELPEIKEALAQGEITEIPDERIAAIKELYGAGAEDAEGFHVGTLGNIVYIDISQSDSDGVRMILSVWPDDAYLMRKTVGVYKKRWDGHLNVTVYENQNGEAFAKITEHRRWFAYFRDRMWED